MFLETTELMQRNLNRLACPLPAVKFVKYQEFLIWINALIFQICIVDEVVN